MSVTIESGPVALGAFVRDRRKQLNLTQVELADRLGTIQSYVSMVERGEIESPRRERLELLAAVLGVDPARLLSIATWSNIDAYMERRETLSHRIASMSPVEVDLFEIASHLSERDLEELRDFAGYLAWRSAGAT